MRTSIIRISTSLLVAITMLSCSTNTSNSIMDSDMQICDNLWQSYVELLKNGNPTTIANKFTENAVIVYPNIPDIVGKKDITQQLSLTFPNIKMAEFDYEIRNYCVTDSCISNYIIV
jgi:hypothetical protein